MGFYKLICSYYAEVRARSYTDSPGHAQTSRQVHIGRSFIPKPQPAASHTKFSRLHKRLGSVLCPTFYFDVNCVSADETTGDHLPRPRTAFWWGRSGETEQPWGGSSEWMKQCFRISLRGCCFGPCGPGSPQWWRAASGVSGPRTGGGREEVGV